MKNRLLSFTLICAIAALPAVQVQAQEKKEDQTELGGHMDKIGGAWRALKRQVTDATKNEDSLKRIATVKENMVAALKLEPAMKADKPAAEQAKFLADYRDRLKIEIAKIEKIEAALKAGNNEEAGKIIAEVDQDQKDAHKAFKKQKAKKA